MKITATFLLFVMSAGIAAQEMKKLSSAASQQSPELNRQIEDALKNYAGPRYERYEAMIPSRDGVLLHTTVIRPIGSDGSGTPLPFLMARTPYGIDHLTELGVIFSNRKLAASGYIFVFQDIRGCNGS